MAMAMKKDKNVDCGSCAFCGVKEDSDNKLKHCSRCKLVAYCGRECQAAHWKNGHKPMCIALKDRKPLSNTQTPQTANLNDETLTTSGSCVICLGIIKASDSCKLPCEHIFHRSCVSDLRSQAPSLICPLCRKDLPPGPEQAYTEALGIFYSLKDISVLSSDERTASIEMLRLFTCAGEEGHASAQFILGCFFHNGEYGVDKNQKKAFQWNSKAANQGHADAQCNLGNMYRAGEGIEKNLERAIQYYSMAADQGHDGAQYNLGQLYAIGEGVKKNTKKAIQYYLKAADQGHAYAQNSLGVMYDIGKGVERNIKKAIQYFSKAADQGHADAQYSLGNMYDNGEGFEKNTKKAIQYYSKAADQGVADAQFNLGVIYYSGEHVKKNTKKAIQYFLKAADQGHADAQYNLGCMYDSGEGVEISPKKSIQYFSMAADQGHAGAQSALEIVSKERHGSS